MKWIIFVSGVFLMSLPACGLKDKERELERKAGELHQKEQELLLKERYLQVKEQQLSGKEKLLDSSLAKNQPDSIPLVNPQLPGLWYVKMSCIQTTCSGSAVGDVKNEQWDIGYVNNTVIAKAMSGNELVRVYTGNFNGTSLQLTANPGDAEPQQTATMRVTLVQTRDNEMEGQREITRVDDCKIIYALELKKK